MDSLMDCDNCFVKEIWPANTQRASTMCGNLYFTGNYSVVNGGKLFQTHIHTSRTATQCAKCLTEALSRVMSVGLRNGIPAQQYIDELRGMRCMKQTSIIPRGMGLSCPDAIARALMRMPKTMKIGEKEEDGVTDTK